MSLLLNNPQRFWSKVQQPLELKKCWEWTGAKGQLGYGSFRTKEGMIGSHRYAYETLKGSIPKGKHLDHLCRNPSCVNPFHLEPVTSRENTLRSPIAPASINARKTHCRNGHPLGGDNLVESDRKRGKRICRVCYNARKREYISKIHAADREKYNSYMREYRKKRKSGGIYAR